MSSHERDVPRDPSRAFPQLNPDDWMSYSSRDEAEAALLRIRERRGDLDKK